MSLKGLGLINNEGFYVVAKKIREQYQDIVTEINNMIVEHYEEGYILTTVDTGTAFPLQNYYEALGYKVVIHTGRTKDTIAIGWEF